MNISFEFTAGDKVLPAGRYTISSTVGPMPWVKTQGIRNKAITQLFTIARLAPGDAPSDKLRLVFDKIGDRRFLSEVWFPKSDGLLVRGTPEEHKHEVLKSEQ